MLLKKEDIRLMNEEYKILQIIPCNGNWVSVGQDSDSEGYYYVPIAAWALVLYKASEHLEEFQSVVPLISSYGDKELRERLKRVTGSVVSLRQSS